MATTMAMLAGTEASSTPGHPPLHQVDYHQEVVSGFLRRPWQSPARSVSPSLKPALVTVSSRNRYRLATRSVSKWTLTSEPRVSSSRAWFRVFSQKSTASLFSLNASSLRSGNEGTLVMRFLCSSRMHVHCELESVGYFLRKGGWLGRATPTSWP